MATKLKIRSSKWVITIESFRGAITAYLGHDFGHIIGINQSGQKVDNLRDKVIKDTDIDSHILAALWTLLDPTDKEANHVYYCVTQWMKTGSHESYIDRVVRGECTFEQLLDSYNSGFREIPVGFTDEEWQSRELVETTKDFLERIVFERSKLEFLLPDSN